MAYITQQAIAAAAEALHKDRCSDPGCVARSREENDARIVLVAALPFMDAGPATDPLQRLAAIIGALGNEWWAHEGDVDERVGVMLQQLAARIREGA